MANIKMTEEEIEKILIKDKRSYESGVTESLIWKRKKAGKIYSDYQTRAKNKGIAVPRIEDVEVSPDNFELVEKISQGNTGIKDDLMEKVLH